MWGRFTRRMHQDRDLNKQVAAVAVAAIEAKQAKERFDHVVAQAYNDDQFRQFAEDARKSRF